MRALFRTRIICGRPRVCSGCTCSSRASHCDSRVPSATITETLPRAFAGICDRHRARDLLAAIGAQQHLQVDRGAGLRTRVPSIQTRSSVALRGCSLASISRVSASSSTSSNALRSRKLIGADHVGRGADRRLVAA